MFENAPATDFSNLLADALRHHSAGDFNAAERLYRLGLVIDPCQPDCLNLLGVLALQRGLPEWAAATIEKAIVIRDDAPHYHNNLGWAFRDMGRLDRAESCYRKTLRLNPEFTEARNNLSKIVAGYVDRKWHCITTAINDPNFNFLLLPPGYGRGLDERIVEYPWLFSRLPEGGGRLLDAGSILTHKTILSHPALKSKKCFISTLAPEDSAAWQDGISYIYEDLRYSCFRDEFFDYVICISVLEHVGMDNTLNYTSDQTKCENDRFSFLQCVSELSRVTRPGGVTYITVPYGTYANHGWLQLFDSAMIDKTISTFEAAEVRETVYLYGPDGWQVSNRLLAAGAGYRDNRSQGPLPELPPLSAESVVCLELRKRNVAGR